MNPSAADIASGFACQKQLKRLARGDLVLSTTLLISPHQKHNLLQEIGNKLAEEEGVDFLYADLRKRYSDSRRMTKGQNLYRQQHCGCVYSEWERYANIKIE